MKGSMFVENVYVEDLRRRYLIGAVKTTELYNLRKQGAISLDDWRYVLGG